MLEFDVSKGWVILAPFRQGSPGKAVEDLARYIALLARQGGVPRRFLPILDAMDNAEGPVPGMAPEDGPVIVLNSGDEQNERTGFTWRAGPDRVEIYGDSRRGLCNGIYEFLRALGLSWPVPGREKLPPVARLGKYPLGEQSSWRPSPRGEEGILARRRLVFSRRDLFKRQDLLFAWAARNGIDALALPFRERGLFHSPDRRNAFLDLARAYSFVIEEGGWDLSRLVPRRLFFLHRDMFRMEEGRRQIRYNFCPTNPDTIRCIQREAAFYFQSAREGSVFHLWPDQGKEQAWCSCPTCRAFSPREQNRIAVNAAADVLLRLQPKARLSFYDLPGEGNIALRPNLFPLEHLPGEPGAEALGFYGTRSFQRGTAGLRTGVASRLGGGFQRGTAGLRTGAVSRRGGRFQK